MRKLLVLAAAALSMVATSASAMTVAEFLAKAKALQAQGMLAAFSSDVTLLKNEMAGISAAYRADLEGFALNPSWGTDLGAITKAR